MRLYKLTDQQGRTRVGRSNETTWGEGTTHTATGQDIRLCTDGVIHAYRHPLIAVLLNPAHANITKPVMWIAEGAIVVETADKCGVRSLTTLKRRMLPKVTTEHCVRFAIACALEIHKETSFVLWANGWLSGKDRSRVAAHAAYVAARAADAAYAAAYAAEAAYAAAADAAADAAVAAVAAADAADAAATKLTPRRLIQIAKWAITTKPY